MTDPVPVSRAQWALPLLAWVLVLVITWLVTRNWAAFYAVAVGGGLILGTLGVVRAVREARRQSRS